MKAARLIVLGVALAAGGMAAFLVTGEEDPQKEAPPQVVQLPTVDVLIAASDIAMGTAIAAKDMQWQAWPAATTSGTFVLKKDRPNAIDELSGSISRAAFTSGEPIREAKLIKATGAAGYMAASRPFLDRCRARLPRSAAQKSS